MSITNMLFWIVLGAGGAIALRLLARASGPPARPRIPDGMSFDGPPPGRPLGGTTWGSTGAYGKRYVNHEYKQRCFACGGRGKVSERREVGFDTKLAVPIYSYRQVPCSTCAGLGWNWQTQSTPVDD